MSSLKARCQWLPSVQYFPSLGNSDVDILICYLEIILSTAKLYELEVRVCDQSALAGRLIRHYQIALVRVKRHQHIRSIGSGCQNIGILDLGQAGVVPDGALLGGTGSACQIGYALGIFIFASFFTRVTILA